jgi:hypothetical protein
MTATKAARLGVAAVALSVVLAAGAVRMVSEGRSQLTESDAAWQKGDALGAAVHARSAARALVPGAAHMRLGYERLRQVAEVSERKGDVEAALFAWRAVLSADDASRPFSAASGEARALAEASVARLSAAPLASGRSPSAGRRALAPEIAVSAALPGVGWGALLLGGAALWCGAGARLAARGWGDDGRLVRAELRMAAVMALAGLVAWFVGLLFA